MMPRTVSSESVLDSCHSEVCRRLQAVLTCPGVKEVDRGCVATQADILQAEVVLARTAGKRACSVNVEQNVCSRSLAVS